LFFRVFPLIWSMKKSRPFIPSILLITGIIQLIASVSGGAADLSGVRINEVQSANGFTLADAEGDYSDWIEIRNEGNGAVPLAGFGMTDDADSPFKWTFPAVTLESGGFLIVHASGKKVPFSVDEDRRELHAPFELDARGETVVLSAPDGRMIDRVTFGPIPLDASFGRSGNGGDGWSFFEIPTPGRLNGAGFPSVSGRVTIQPPAGFYSGGVSVSLSADPGETVRYTLDGSDPGRLSKIGSGPVLISSTSVLKARAFGPESMAGPVSTSTYFIDEDVSTAAVSLSMNPDFLFDPDIGIYVAGNGTHVGGYPGFPTGSPANYWEDWERTADVEFFEPGGAAGFSARAGVSIHGKTTRMLPQKSFAVFARGKYGAEWIEYPLFPDLPVETFKSFVLRNGGSDNIATQGAVHFRDGLTSRLVRSLDLESLAFRPCVVFLNGAYWGIYEIRENLNRHYLESHFGVDPDAVDILDDYHKLRPWVVEGSAESFNELIDFLSSQCLADDSAAGRVEEWMDVDDYLTYMAVQIYFANQDGPGHNCKFWRPQTPSGRFRWLLYDTDHSFGLQTFVPNAGFNPAAYADNTIAYYREADGPSWPNPPESTFLFRKILENAGFRNRFVNRLADLLNSVFTDSVVAPAISSIHDELEPEIGRHTARWGSSPQQWERNVGVLYDFARERPEFLRGFLESEFGLNGQAMVRLSASPGNGGGIRMNSLTVSGFPWSGSYFKEVAVRIAAVPNPGFRFLRWAGASASPDSALSVSLNGDDSFEAVFTREGASVSENRDAAAPCAFELRPNFPNPFNSSTRIEFTLPNRSSVLLRIFDVHGRVVRVPSDRQFETGVHSVVWDGKDSEGGEVPSGVYVCILRAGIYSSSIKILHVR
jgi:hypothetical protein